MDFTNSLQSPTFQCNTGDVLPFCQSCVSVPVAHTVVSHCVTFTTIPCQSSAITEFPQRQTPVRRSADLSSEGTCENCKLAKKDSLNRQVVELLKKHTAVEVDGKEILGWYILLAAEERNIIKEFGGLEKFLKGNPSLQPYNNWVTLKSKSYLKTFDNSCDIYCTIMEKPESFSHKYNPNYSKVCSEGVLHPPGYGQSGKELITDVIPQREALWLDQTDTEEQRCENELSAWEYETQAAPCLEVWDSENDCPQTSGDPPYPGVSSNVQVKTPDLMPAVPNVCESLHDSGITEGDLVIESTNLVFKESGRVAELNKIYDSLQFQTYRSENSDHSGDQDCSASDLLDDETFLSVRSGSFHSRSSSQFSLDDTDVEQCTFEEALEDLSSFSLYSQVNPPPGLPFTSTDTRPPSAIINPSTEVKKASKTDCYIKGTPIVKTGPQCTGVNPDMTNGLSSLTQDTEQAGNGASKKMEDCKGVSDGLPSASSEARAVKAEILLLDVQRWLCLQLCWKTQQQSMETEPFLSLHRAPTDQPPTGVRFNLMAALAEVEEKYQEMKKQIQSGIPLDALKPLNMQLTELKSPADNLLKECFMDTPQHSTLQNRSDSASWGFKKTNSVANDLTSTSLSATQDTQERGEGGRNSGTQSGVQQAYYVHVGNIAPSVTEEQVLNVFQKYKVSNVFLEDSSMMSRYAVLIFTSPEQAQAAVKEMNLKELWGKKLKVRAVNNSNSNFPIAFKTSGTLPQGGVKIGSTVPEGCYPSLPSAFGRAPKTGPHVDTPIAQGGGSGRDFFMSVTNQYGFFPHNNVNKVFPATSYSNSPSVMPPGSQWMLPAPYPNMAYSGTPYPMAVPYMYPLSSSPSCTPCPLQVPMTNTNIFTPDINMKPNAPTYVGKLGSNYVPVKSVKPMHATNGQSRGRAKLFNVRDAVQKNTRPSTAGTLVPEREANAGGTTDKPTAAQTVSKPASVFTSNDWKLSDTVSVANTPTSLVKEGTAVSESVSSPESLLSKPTSGPSIYKPAAPLRVPTFVPCSVTIEGDTETSANATSNTGTLSQSTDKAHVRSSVAGHQEDPPPYTLMDWSMAELEKEAAEFNMIVIPNRFNFYQYQRVFNYLTDHHKDVPSQQISDTLEEMRRSRGGYLCGVPIPEIIAEACSKLAARKKAPV
ncbi:RNA-binding protein 44 isoform X2 [Pseudophryne corroboree]|uniref:RNA-binding protein 44 isoform X2 n=1 Tax=Pseudophryne corroboree TaxID=495146 RepID=UPI0030817EC5